MFLSLERETQTCGGPCPLPNGLPLRDDDQDGNGEEIGKHSEDVGRNERELAGFKVKLKGIDPAEEKGPENSSQGIPQCKDDHGDGDPSLARCHVLLPSGRVGEGKIGTSKACQHPTEDGPEIANLNHGDPSRIRSRGVFSDRSQIQARSRVVEKEPSAGHQEITEVSNRGLVEKDGAEDGDIFQNGERQLNDSLRYSADNGPSEETRKADAKDGKRQATNYLIRPERDGENAVKEGQHPAHDHCR